MGKGVLGVGAVKWTLQIHLMAVYIVRDNGCKQETRLGSPIAYKPSIPAQKANIVHPTDNENIFLHFSLRNH